MNFYPYICIMRKNIFRIIVVSIITVIGLSGCDTENASVSSTDIEITGRPIDIYDMDSCEYVGHVWGVKSDVLAHRGQCKYCKARQEKMIRSIIEEMLSEVESD